MLKKIKSVKSLVIALLVGVMLATTAVSLAYWVSEVKVGTEDKGLTITIGTGRGVETELSLSDVSGSHLKLIPLNKTPIDNYETTKITFTINIKWLAFDENSQPKTSLTGREGEVDIELIKIRNENDVPLLNEGLFNCLIGDIAPVYCNNATAVPVVIEVTLNEPADAEQYNKIAGQTVYFTFRFTVTDKAA